MKAETVILSISPRKKMRATYDLMKSTNLS